MTFPHSMPAEDVRDLDAIAEALTDAQAELTECQAQEGPDAHIRRSLGKVGFALEHLRAMAARHGGESIEP